jgi:hypothetical protein
MEAAQMNTTMKQSAAFASVAALALLGGCGGGSGNDAVQTSSPPPASAEFVFDNTPASSPLYLRVDRTGAPAVGTALLSRDTAVVITGVGGGILNPGTAANPFNDQRDQLNRGDPVNDARDFAATFVAGPQPNSLQNIHFKIARELRALGLTPCSTEPAGGATTRDQVNVDVCVAQAAPVIIPDVITYDFAAPEGFPNGRTFDDPVVDRILAAALLRISGPAPPHHLNSLLGVINTWNGPAGVACPTPCRFTGDETGAFSPATFPYMRPAYP